MQTLDFIDKKSLRDDIPEFAPGDTLNVHVNIVEGKNRRVQVFKGFVVGRQGAGAVVDQGDEVGLPRAPRPHQESVVRAPSAAQLLDPLHELAQKGLADHEELLQVLRRHGRGGEARGPHEAASQIRRRRAQVHWSAG